MKKLSNKKLFLFGTLFVSILSVGVAAISSMAWFQINTVGKNMTATDNIVTTGSSNLTINNVTAYKTTYDDLDSNTIDYSHEHVTQYVAKGNAATVNINQGAITGFDVPEEGVGYYILGDDKWALSHGKEATDAWKYESGIRMDDDVLAGSNNKAIGTNVYLAEGASFRIKHHYFNNSTIADDWVTSVANNNAYTTAALNVSSGNFVVKTNQSGYYNIYLLSDNKVSVYPVKLDSNLNAQALRKTRKNTFSGGFTLYLDLSASQSEWESNNAWFRMNVQWDHGSGSWSTYNFTRYGSTHHYYCNIPTGTINALQLHRMVGNTQDKTLYVGDPSGKNCLKVTGWDTVSYYYYWMQNNDIGIIGQINGGSWAQDYVMYRDSTNNCLYRYVKLYSANAHFKIRWGTSNWDNSTPSSDYVINGSSANDIYLIKIDYSYNITVTKVNYIMRVWNSAGQNGTDYSTTLQADGKTFKITNQSLLATRKFKMVNTLPSASYYGYDNCTVTTSNEADGCVQNANDGGNNIKINYEGSYSIEYTPYSNLIHVSGATLTSPAGAGNSVTYYLEANSSVRNDWHANNARFAIFVINEDGENTRGKWYDLTHWMGYVYSVTIPVEHTKMYFTRMTPSDANNNWANRWNQTVEITAPLSPLCYYILGGKSDVNYTGSWNIFYYTPYGFNDNTDTDGYYLVGNEAFTGSNEVEWSFAAAKKMTVGGSNPQGISGEVVAHFDGVTLSSGMQFKIWKFNYGTTVSDSYGRSAEYNSLNSDETTSGVAEISGSNISIKTGISGKYSIYLMNNNKIVITDDETAGFVFFNQSPETYSTTVFKMGYGDHTSANNPTNYLIYEQGIKITAADITNGVSFVIRNRRGGSTTWYKWSDSGDHGLVDSSSLVKGTASNGSNYGDDFSHLSSGEYGYLFTDPGYYKFYLTSNGKISIAQMPGDYGEGYYIVPYNSAVAGANKTNHYTNGIKMKEIDEPGVTNIAVYTCYSVTTANMSIFFRAYINGVDKTTTAGSNTVYCAALDTETYATMTNGVLTFKNPGSYNIYLFYSNGTITCSIAEYTKANFFTLNQINKSLASQADIKAANTSLVLQVDFTTTNAGYNVEALLDIVKTNSGASQYIDYTYAVTDSIGNYDNCYDYMRGEHYIGGNNLSPTNLSSGSHTMYILIDYKYSAISGLSYSTPSTNDFYFVLKMRQTT